MYAFGLKSGYILHQNGPLKKKDYGFQRQSDEKPSIIPGCPAKWTFAPIQVFFSIMHYLV